MRVVAATASVAAAAVASYVLFRHRSALRQLVLPPPVQPPPVDDEDACAICLERPQEAVKTQCNHRFCLDCFRSWASRQVPPNSTARCPLCTTTVVRLTPEAWPDATSAALDRTRWLVGYNLEATLTVKLAWASRALEAVRSLSGSVAVGLYVLSGHAWEQAHESMRYSFAPVPVPFDVRLRASSRWLVSAHVLWLLQRVFQEPDDPRHVQLTMLLARLRPLALLAMAFARDVRHARLLVGPVATSAARLTTTSTSSTLLPLPSATSAAVATAAGMMPPPPPPVDDTSSLSATLSVSAGVVDARGGGGVLSSALLVLAPTLQHASHLCRAAYLTGGVLRVARTAALAAHAAAPEAARAPPLVLRGLDLLITICEFIGVAMHCRIELLGLRGLFVVISWANDRLPTVVRRVRPHESGLWSRRYCEVEEVHATLEALSSRPHAQPTLTTTRRGLRWEDALAELQVPLRALYAFYGERGLRARGFPPWAIEGIRTMTLPDDVA